MPQGYFTIEEWKPATAGGAWMPILHLGLGHNLTKALAALEQRGQPGLYRVLQMRRCVWAEVEEGKLRLHGSHASSPENLAHLAEIYEREGGRRPVAQARRRRAAAKGKSGKK